MRRPRLAILTNERDFAADEVIHQLDSSHLEIIRFNYETCTTHPAWLCAVGCEDDPVSHEVVWWRQFNTDAQATTLADVDALLIERAQWRSFLSSLDQPGSRWVNPLWPARRAENKIEQLRAAQRMGLAIPPTLITNSPQKAREFTRRHGSCVIKSLNTAYFEFSDQGFVFTEQLHQELLEADAELWYRQPVIIQTRIDREADIRIIAFRNHAFGAITHSPGSDWRKNPAGVDWRPYSVNPHFADLCRSYLSVMGLRYAAFDFALSENRLWFLEANQAGEWHFLDKHLKLGISRALAYYLADLASGDEK